jgi:hypothetical protein
MKLQVMFGDVDEWAEADTDDLSEVCAQAFAMIRDAEWAYVKDAELGVVLEPDGGWDRIDWRLYFDGGVSWGSYPDERLFTTEELVTQYRSSLSLLGSPDSSPCSCGGTRYHLALSPEEEWQSQCRECFQWAPATTGLEGRLEAFKRPRPSGLV